MAVWWSGPGLALQNSILPGNYLEILIAGMWGRGGWYISVYSMYHLIRSQLIISYLTPCNNFHRIATPFQIS